MTKVVGVRFSDTGKTYYFDPKGLDIKNGDEIIVETANGLEFGKASCGVKEVEDDEVVSPLKPVIRIANDNDREKVNEKGIVTIVFQTVGASTEKMAHLKAGDAFEDFVGPLGCPSELIGEDIEELKKKKLLRFALKKQKNISLK